MAGHERAVGGSRSRTGREYAQGICPANSGRTRQMGQADPVGQHKGSMKIASVTSNRKGKQVMSKSSSATDYSLGADAALDVRPITPAIGAEIHGVRLSGGLPAAPVTAIRDAL